MVKWLALQNSPGKFQRMNIVKRCVFPPPNYPTPNRIKFSWSFFLKFLCLILSWWKKASYWSLWFSFFFMGKPRASIKPLQERNTTLAPAVWWKMFQRKLALKKPSNWTLIPAGSASHLPHRKIYHPASRNKGRTKLSSAKEWPGVAHAAGIWRA